MWNDASGNTYVVEQDNHSKKETLLVRRSPDGQVTTLAGNGYGHRDGKGSSASFGSIGGMHIAADGSIYLTDGTSIRRVTSDGSVSTLATNLTKRTVDDAPLLFGKNDGILAGLTIDRDKNIYLADAGNQRLLEIAPDSMVKVVYRGESSYYPNGVTVDGVGNLYVLEVGFNPPATWLPVRVRKITSSGSSSIIAVASQSPAGQSANTQPYSRDDPHSPYRFRYLGSWVSTGILAFSVGAWIITRRSRS
jgi:sugar lactone lactonase YvrE